MDAGRTHVACRTSSACALQLLPAAVANRSPDGARIEALLEQLLAELSLRRQLQKEPGEGADRHQRALDHHDRPRPALIREIVVRRIDRRARPDEDVAEYRLDQPNGDDVAKLRRRSEPLRAR